MVEEGPCLSSFSCSCNSIWDDERKPGYYNPILPSFLGAQDWTCRLTLLGHNEPRSIGLSLHRKTADMLQAANAARRAWLGRGDEASTEEGTWLGAQVTELHIRDWKQVDTGKGRLVTRVPSASPA